MATKLAPILSEFEYQRPVIDKDLTSPPGGESKGDRYLIYGTGSGDWSGHDGDIAVYNGSGWDFVTKVEGMLVYIKDEDKFYKYITSWSALLPTVYSRSFIITNPTSSADGAIWRVPYAITITGLHGVQVGGTNVIGILTECDSDGLNPVAIDTTDITILATNVNKTSFTNPSIDAGDYIGWNTTSVSGNVTKVIITIDYTID